MKYLNDLFKMNLTEPEVKMLDRDYRNAYWDGKAINMPPQAAAIPDLTYHEAAWPFIQSLWTFDYRDEQGAFANSLTDVFTVLVQQSRTDQEDWTVAPGAVAWLKGEDPATSTDQRPLRSLQSPGTAYDDPVLGKDPQVSRYDERKRVPEDNGGVHVNSGIPNKAFYEVAARLGLAKAREIWIEAVKHLPPHADFKKAAQTTLNSAASRFGRTSPEQVAVRDAWLSVGLPL